MHDVFCKQYGGTNVSHLEKWNVKLIKTQYWAHSMVGVYDKRKNTKRI
jgi:hypothetical protein